MRAAELVEVNRLLFQAAGGVVRAVREMHGSIARRAFAAAGPAAVPARVIHDVITAGVYGAVLGGVRLAAAGSTAMLQAVPLDEATPLQAGRRGALALAILNGAYGDRLAAAGSPLEIEMRLIVPDSEPTGRMTIFIHGLMENESSWFPGGDPSGSFGARLALDLGHTPIHAVYNSGLPLAANGRRLSDLIERLVGDWPVQIDELNLVGHSMGGLLARAACHEGGLTGRAWVASLTRLISLGTPHLGAPLEKLAHAGQWALDVLPETRPLASLIGARSAGIRNLRHGRPLHDSPDLREADLPLHPTAAHHFAGATLARDPASIGALLLGDMLVWYPSASGQGRSRRIPVDPALGRHFGGLSHFDLLTHDEVYRQLRDWLSEPSQLSL